MIQLGYMEALGDWEYVNYSGNRLLKVTAEDIQWVANEYLITNNSSVAIYKMLPQLILHWRSLVHKNKQ